MSRYEKLLVGVTESEPSVMNIDNVISILRQLLPDSGVEFIHVKGSVELGTAVIELDFDVCCSGNPAVLERMAERGYKTHFVERSMDSIFSGTQERHTYVASAIARSQARSKNSLTEFKLLETSKLRPIEKINPAHFQAIEEDLLRTGIMNQPLIVDGVTMAVLDGSHRYAFLVKHGFLYAPVILCDYDDESIFVGNHLGHRFEFDQSKWISKQHVRATAFSKVLYEPRTTRHFFPFRKQSIPTKLTELLPQSIQSIEHLIADVRPDQEIIKNEEYIDELNSEIQMLQKYINEQNQVLEWLKHQNNCIRASSSDSAAA